jgi:hypothetical protein
VCNQDIYKPFMIKERKRKSREQKRGKENKRKKEKN